MNHLQGRTVLVLGLGASGLAMARWCAAFGAGVRVWDSRSEPPQAAALAADVPEALLFSGPLEAGALAGVQLVLKSPGLSPLDARLAPLLDEARATGIAVQGELDLFARALTDLQAERGYAPKLLAITGTNGKTTTTALTALLVERCGRRVATAGNIGPTMLDTLRERLALEPAAADASPRAGAAAAAGQHDAPAPATADAAPIADGAEAQAPRSAAAPDMSPEGPGTGMPTAGASTTAVPAAPAGDAATPPVPLAAPADDDDTPLQLAPPPAAAPSFEHLPEVWVLELSSFQLDGVRGFEPSAAAMLNITQDHLDWHGDMCRYVEAKARIWGTQATLVVNRDDPAVEATVPAPVVVQKGAKGKPAKTRPRKVVRFGLDAPQAPGDYGVVVEGGMAWLVRALALDPTDRRRDARDEPLHLQHLMPADALRIRGRHNAANALAALALAGAIGCPLAPMLHGLREYAGEPHRVAFVTRVGEVEAFDDSKGTNVGATLAALLGLGADKAPAKLVAIFGGDGKGQDFAPLAAPVQRHVRAMALIGRDAGAIERALAATGVPMQRHASLEAATAWCFAQAQPGDAVLLSPACASLDMFRDYAHRADVFVDAVRALAGEQGREI